MDNNYMKIAQELSANSHCLRRKVGAILITGDKKKIITSINNPRPYKEICEELGCLRDQKNISSGTCLEICRCIHCEQDLIQQCTKAKIPTKDALIYTTLFPCSLCAQVLINAKIKKIVYVEPYGNNSAMTLFDKTDIIIEKYNN